MSTTGIELKTRRRALAEAVELVSSMRFAISLLVILSIAAIIGTVLLVLSGYIWDRGVMQQLKRLKGVATAAQMSCFDPLK